MQGAGAQSHVPRALAGDAKSTEYERWLGAQTETPSSPWRGKAQAAFSEASMECIQAFQCSLPRIDPSVPSSLSWQLERGISKLAWKSEVWPLQLLSERQCSSLARWRVQLRFWGQNTSDHSSAT